MTGVLAKLRGKHVQQFFCIEVFAGTGRLTAVLRQFGMNESFGVDCRTPARLTSPLIRLDLTDPIQVKHLETLMSDPFCIFCHFAPPCGTASRARLIQRKGRFNPPVLRTDQHPDGLPTLTGIDADRVRQANLLYRVTCQLATFCYRNHILFSIENPGRSFMWQTTCFQEFLQQIPVATTKFHHCCYGSARRKLTSLVHMVPSFSALQAFCQGDHDHEPWGQCAMAPNGWATSHETAYPWALCRSLAFALSDWLQQQGLIFPPLCFAQQEASLQTLRAATGTQSRKPLPPLVPEFAAILRHPADAPLPPLSRKLSTPRPGHFASEEIRKGEAEQVTETKEHITIGIHWAPEEFVAEAIRVGHPALLASNFPVEMIEANNFCASRTDYEVAKHRTEVVKRWLSLANDFSQAEAKNKDSLSTRRRQVLEKKRLHLFDQLIREAGHSDTTLAECIRHGFDLTGKLPRSNFFEEKFRPASLPCETLRKICRPSSRSHGPQLQVV